MSNVRTLKKEIDELVFAVISDCFAYSGIHPEAKDEAVSEIINEAVNLRNNLVQRVNHPASDGDPKKIKAHFQSVKTDLISGTDKLFSQLSSLTKKKKK